MKKHVSKSDDRIQGDSEPLNQVTLPRNLDGKNNPCYFYCNHCKKTNVSEVNISPNLKTWIFCGVCSLCCLCFVPFFIKECNSLHHYCSVCNHKVGFTY